MIPERSGPNWEKGADRFLVAGCGICIGLLLAVLALVRPWQSTGDPTLVVGTNPWPGYELLYLAHDKGFFAEEGLPVRFVECFELDDCRLAFERGNIDVMGSTVNEILLAAAVPKVDPVILLAADYSNGADVIIARPPYSSLSQLRGRSVGVENTPLSHYMIARAAGLEGLNPRDFKLVSLTQGEMAAAMANGDIDAVVTFPPLSESLLGQQPGLRVIFDSRAIPGEIVDVISARGDALVRFPDLPQKLRGVWRRALDYYRSSTDDAVAIMARREGLSPDAFLAAMGDLHLVDDDAQRSALAPDGPVLVALSGARTILEQMGLLSAQIPTEPLIRREHLQ